MSEAPRYVGGFCQDREKCVAITADRDRVVSTHKGLMQALEQRIELLEHDMKSGDYESLYAQAVEEVKAKQAQIDRLMLEYCPTEMTAEQVTEWRRHQVPAEDSQFAASVLPK